MCRRGVEARSVRYCSGVSRGYGAAEETHGSRCGVRETDGPGRDLRSWLRGAEVGVLAGDPVFARRGEDVEVDGVFEGEDFMRKGGGDGEDLVGTEEHFAYGGGLSCDATGAVDGPTYRLVEEELQASGEDGGDLLVMVGVERDGGAFFEGGGGGATV